jgi:hypothetical protein
MKILILVMSHETDDKVFDEYKKIWNKQINEHVKEKYPIDVLYLYTDNNISENYIIDGNKLISKCPENYWDSLLIKVVNGFEYGREKKYDYVFKTNLSTIINYPKFYDYCLNIDKNRKYIYDGVIGNYEDYSFCSGAGMLLNQESINIVLDNKDKISKKWTDDIFIGYILNKLYNISPCDLLNRFDIVTPNKVFTENMVTSCSHIRIKIRIDDQDVHYTNLVYNILHGEKV